VYVIQVFTKSDYVDLPSTLKPSKKVVQEEVDELNSNVSKDTLRVLPVKYKYRCKKVKRSKQ